jgi:hypothetical protein
MFVKPADRASNTASRARSAECIRPSRFNSASRNDWTPKLTRLTPAARNPLIRSDVDVSGLVSSVTSAPSVTLNASRQAAISRFISTGSKSDGVPPPKKMVSTGSPRPPLTISDSSAAM